MKSRLLLSTAAVVVALAAPAAFQTAAARELLSDEEMQEARGGVLVAGGLAFEFGAVLRTFEDGSLSLQTQVNWTPTGAVVEQITGAGVARLADPALTVFAGAGEEITGADGVFLTGSGAAIIHEVSQGQIVNMLLNTASNREFRQDTDITLVLPGFADLQADFTQQITGLRLADEIRFAMSAIGE